MKTRVKVGLTSIRQSCLNTKLKVFSTILAILTLDEVLESNVVCVNLRVVTSHAFDGPDDIVVCFNNALLVLEHV